MTSPRGCVAVAQADLRLPAELQRAGDVGEDFLQLGVRRHLHVDAGGAARLRRPRVQLVARMVARRQHCSEIHTLPPPTLYKRRCRCRFIGKE